MNTKILAYLTLSTGLALSAVAGYYSIIGLTTIFPGDFWSIVILGTTLEIAKLVAVSWLYNHWDIATKSVKTYMSISVLVLMLITSMGIFGFLSKSHIDQSLKLELTNSSRIELLQKNIDRHQEVIDDYNKQKDVIDDAIRRAGSSKNTIRLSDSQSKKRKEIMDLIAAETEKQFKLKEELFKLTAEKKKFEAEFGPLKYVSELLFDNSDEKKFLEKSVRFVIIIIIFVFDPLAIFLLLAFNMSLKKMREEKVMGSVDMDYIELNSQNKNFNMSLEEWVYKYPGISDVETKKPIKKMPVKKRPIKKPKKG